MNWNIFRLWLLIVVPGLCLFGGILAWWLGMGDWKHVLVLFGYLELFVLGTTIHYHRHLTHRSFRFRGLGHIFHVLFAWSGAAGMMGPFDWWVAIHKKHHKHSDGEQDPHSPVTKGFLYSHMFWMLHIAGDAEVARYRSECYEEFDWFNRLFCNRWFYFIVGPGLAALAAFWFAGLWGLLWYGAAVCVNTHMTWSVNSLGHSRFMRYFFSYKSRKAPDESRNNWILAFCTAGEHFHGNHHDSQKSYKFARKVWEVPADQGYLILSLIKYVGGGIAKPHVHLQSG